MNVLLTGATGFIGSNLLPKLLRHNYNVTCLVRDTKKGERLQSKYDVNIRIGDVTQPKSLVGISKGINYVINLAAMGHVNAITDESYKLFTGINEGGGI